MRKPTAADLPFLRNARDTYRSLLDHCNLMRKESNNVAELIAIATVHDQLTNMFEAVGRQLSRAETSQC